MSESSDIDGESSYGYNSRRSNESSVSRQSSISYDRPSTPALPAPTTPSSPKFTADQIKTIRTSLKDIEDFISKGLASDEKTVFVTLFRDTIIKNEEEVLQFPTPSFFISKFEIMDKKTLNDYLKTKIVGLLYDKQHADKHKNSKLKYW